MEKEYLIEKWLNDELTSEELEVFKTLDEYQYYVDIVENAQDFKASLVSKVDDFDTFNQKLKTEKTKVPRKLWDHPFMRIASVIVIAFGLYFALFYNETTEFNTLAQQKMTIKLPDGSAVILNALSEVEFNQKQWDKKREINLKGEAFFKVQKGNTFDVITSEGIVTVIGTEFSVNQRDDFFEVKCFEGIVKVSSKFNSTTLHIGETFRNLNGNLSQRSTNLNEPLWLDNISSFEALPFKEVVAELERQYDLNIELQGNQHNPLFTGGFVHNNLDSALTAITEPLNLTYKIISPKQVIIYGLKK